jgi:hypothetical protein
VVGRVDLDGPIEKNKKELGKAEVGYQLHEKLGRVHDEGTPFPVVEMFRINEEQDRQCKRRQAFWQWSQD